MTTHSFSLVFDNFGVKYEGKEHAKHLLEVLERHYTVTTDWDGKKYIGITLDWDYKRREVHLLMPGYIESARQQLGHPIPAKRQDSPYPHVTPNYGAKKQYAEEVDASPPLDKEGTRRIQQINGKFLFLGQAINSTVLKALGSLGTQQAEPTEETNKQANQLIDYLVSQEEAVLTFRASNMVLAVHSDASYLSESKARSCAGGHFFLSNDEPHPPNNGAILTIAQVIKVVMLSASEAELATLFINACTAVHIRNILAKLGHPQPQTPVQMDNATVEALINGKKSYQSGLKPWRCASIGQRTNRLK